LLTKQAQIKREKTKEDLRPFLTIQGQASALGAFPVDSILVLLFGAFLWGVSTVFYKKFLTRVDPFVTHFVQLAVGSVFLCVWVLGLAGSLCQRT